MNCISYNDELIDYEMMCADCYLDRWYVFESELEEMI